MSVDQAKPTSPANVLVVCTGNVCRSPVAERLLGAALGPSVTVASAGVGALVGAPIAEGMVALLRSAGGGTSDGFSARSLSAAMARDADLVLTMTRDQRSAAVESCPAAVRRTFTLLEFARLLDEVDQEALGPGNVADRVRASAPLAASKRRQVAAGPGFDDIADPYRGTEGQYRTAFEEIQRAVLTIARKLLAPGIDQRGTTPEPATAGGDAEP